MEAEKFFKWHPLSEIQSGFVTEFMRVPGGFLVRCFGLKHRRDENPPIAMEFIRTHELGTNKGLLHEKLIEICN